MPKKIDPYKSPAEKGIRLFSRLFFTKKAYSLSELSRWLNASKQTTLRLLADIEKIYGITLESYVENRQKYYRIPHTNPINPHVPLTSDDLRLLELCKSFTSHLLGSQMFQEVEIAIEKACAFLQDGDEFSSKAFDAALFGTIDYTDKADFLRKLAQAVEKHLICTISYRSLGKSSETAFAFKPFKIFSRKDAIYVHGMKLEDGVEQERILALHRIGSVKVGKKQFRYPINYDFASTYNQTFGVIKNKPFKGKFQKTSDFFIL